MDKHKNSPGLLMTIWLTHKEMRNKKAIAKMLGTNPQALEEFEREYQKAVLTNQSKTDNLFEVSAVTAKNRTLPADEIVEDLVERIVEELLEKTTFFEYDGVYAHRGKFPASQKSPVTNEEIQSLPEVMRPELTGTLMKSDFPGANYEMVLWYYQEWLKNGDTPKGRQMYHRFRQGLDILDLDGILYDIIATNPNSMGHWLPELIEAVQKQDFFKVPATRIIQVPMPLLQLTRQEYMGLTATTRTILNRYCMKAFNLDVNRDYFIKTGTYSSKFLFQNAHVPAGKEVTELGEYLMFIHFQALQMAAPTVQPAPIYGASTTTEWVVREYIHDVEKNPCIYHGMPLHTEYRVFVDFDTDAIIGVNPYWDPDIMKKRFSEGPDADTPDKIHDYVIYSMHEKTLMSRYHENVDKVCSELEKMLPDVRLTGQWSIDIMQNGDDFFLIDMGLAQNSAMIECVPKNLLRPSQECWIPKVES